MGGLSVRSLEEQCPYNYADSEGFGFHSLMKQEGRFASRLFLSLPGSVSLPTEDLLGNTSSFLSSVAVAPARPAQNLPDMALVIANLKLLLDQGGHTGTSPQRSLIAGAAQDLRPAASPVAVAASHSSAACAQRVPLSEVRTYLGCDSHAPNGPPSDGSRGAAEQLRLAAIRGSNI